MPRNITTAAKNASQDEVARPILMVDMDFASGHVRLNSGVSLLVWDSNDFLAIGQYGSVSPAEESLETQNAQLSFSLTGVDPSFVSLMFNEHYQGRTAILYFALVDADHVLIDDPVVIFRGRMDNMEIALGNQATITVTATSALADWERPRSRRYNNEDQQLLYPDDKGLEFVVQATDKQVYWGVGAPAGAQGT